MSKVSDLYNSLKHQNETKERSIKALQDELAFLKKEDDVEETSSTLTKEIKKYEAKLLVLEGDFDYVPGNGHAAYFFSTGKPGTSENNLGSFLLSPAKPRLFFFGVSGPAQKAVPVPFFGGGGFYDLFFPDFFFYLRRDFSGGVFGVGKAKTRGSSPEMPKTGSLLAKGEL